MKRHLNLTALIERSETQYLVTSPELGVVSQGETRAEAQQNLQEALDLFLEFAPEAEVMQRFKPIFA